MSTQDVIVPECAASGSYDCVLETIKIDAVARTRLLATMRHCPHPHGDSRRFSLTRGAIVGLGEVSR